ncbi:MAG TPA: SH3 domain-containing protein [Candidatus Binatia bacterium]
MGEKFPRWTYVVIFALLAVVVVLAARALRSKPSALSPSPPAETAVERAPDKDRPADALGGEVAELRRQVEETSSRVKELESRLAETNKALAAAQAKVKAAQKVAERPAAPPAPRERAAAGNSQPPPPSRRAADAGSYEIVRDTAVLERPATSAREVALVQRGTTVNVVGSQGDWLEVRSKYGKPPGYIRRDDAVLRQGQTDNR